MIPLLFNLVKQSGILQMLDSLDLKLVPDELQGTIYRKDYLVTIIALIKYL